MSDVTAALEAAQCEDVVAKAFLDIWPLAEVLLESYAKANRLPIFVYLNDRLIFRSSVEGRPRFCQLMLGVPSLAERCMTDGARRASVDEADPATRVHLCHAGLMNGRTVLNIEHVGRLSILFGSRLADDEAGRTRRTLLLKELDDAAPTEANLLRREVAAAGATSEITQHEIDLMDAISGTLGHLFEATVSARALAITMAHELSQMLLGLGLLAQVAQVSSEQVVGYENVNLKPLVSEARLGLYIVRNFLSHLSEKKYEDIIHPAAAPVDLAELLEEMIELYAVQANEKGISFDIGSVTTVPHIRGYELEIRRALHNVLNNALKYSYRSVGDARRTIRIRTRVPYDPGFRQRRLSINVENYGLGLTADEKSHAFEAGFRGRQARAEVPIGSGIGLSEVMKIMKRHGGEVRLDSRRLHDSHDGDATFLTSVDLIFPY